MTGSEAPPSFRLAYVPGVTPTKWVRIWHERLPGVPLGLVAVSPDEAAGLLRDRGADAGFVRLPVDRTDLSAIPLYTETTVVVVPKDHVVAAVEEVSLADLSDETVLHPLDDTLGWEVPPGRPAVERPATTADAVELVAAGVGLLLVPQSLARLHHRRDLTYRPVADAPQSGVALSWREDETTDLVDALIGIVRGRTVNSTRGRPARAPAPAQSKDKPAAGRAESGRAESGRAESGKSGAGKSAAGKQAGKSAGKSAGRSAGRSGGRSDGKSGGRSAGTGTSGGSRTGSGTPRGGGRGKPRRRS